MLGKLLSIMAIGRAFMTIPPVRRILPNIFSLVLLMAVSAFLLCGLVAGGLGFAYFYMVYNGFDPYRAAIIVGLSACLLTGVLVGAAFLRLYRLQGLSPRMPQPAKGVFDIRALTLCFIDGFLNAEK